MGRQNRYPMGKEVVVISNLIKMINSYLIKAAPFNKELLLLTA